MFYYGYNHCWPLMKSSLCLPQALRGGAEGQGRVTSPSPPTQRSSRVVSAPVVVVSHPGRQEIAASDVLLGDRLGEGHWGVVHQATWTTDTGDKVGHTYNV